MHFSRLISVIALAASCDGLSAQVPSHIAFSTLPPITDSVFQSPISSATAFVDFSNDQIVVVFPDFESNGSHKTVRFGLGDRINPSFSWSVQRTPSGKYSYAYTLVDDPSAPQRSAGFSLLAPAHDASLAPDNRSTWALSTEGTQVPDRSSTVHMASMRRIIWTAPAPGTQMTGHGEAALVSEYRPGFCEINIEGRVTSGLTAEALAALPPAVASEIQRARASGLGIVRRTGICPLFAPVTSKGVVVDNYYLGIQHLEKDGSLDPASSYVQNLSNYLKGYLSAGAYGPIAAPVFEPTTDFERRLQQAIFTALN